LLEKEEKKIKTISAVLLKGGIKMNDNKFKVGQEVIYDSPVGMKKVDIFGYIYHEKEKTWLYAIKLPTNKHVIVRENTLQKGKNIFGLEKGDKFKCKTSSRIASRINEVLSVVGDEKSNQLRYLVKRIDVVSAKAIEEIIYE
jgi:hypothetical protein